MLNKNTKFLIMADASWFFGEGLLGPLFAVFAQRIGGSILDITYAWALYLIVSGLSVIIVGKTARNRSRQQQLVLAGYALNAALTFAYLLVNSSIRLFIVQAGLGIAAAIATPTWDALFSFSEGRRTTGLAWGLADGMSQVLAGMAVVVGGFIVVHFSFTALFVAMGAIQVAAVVLLMPVIRPVLR